MSTSRPFCLEGSILFDVSANIPHSTPHGEFIGRDNKHILSATQGHRECSISMQDSISMLKYL